MLMILKCSTSSWAKHRKQPYLNRQAEYDLIYFYPKIIAPENKSDFKILSRPDVMVHNCNQNAGEAKAGESQIQVLLHSERTCPQHLGEEDEL